MKVASFRRVQGVAAGVFGMLGASACVPTGNAPPYDAGSTAPSFSSGTRPSVNVMTAPFEDNFDRPNTPLGVDPAPSGTNEVASAPPDAGADAGLRLAMRTGKLDAGDGGDDTDGGSKIGAEAGAVPAAGPLGPNWTAKSAAWRIENGQLCVQGAHNRGVWLNKTLPINARIEFDAIAGTDEGDLKAELWGDGMSTATGTSYTNATSYLAILGGWKNSLHVLARINEHGGDRKEIKVDKESDDPRQRSVVKGQTYHFKIERSDGKTVRWSVDGVDYPSYVDSAPLIGGGHDHFGFNEWEAKVCFDNVKVTPLSTEDAGAKTP